MSKAVAEQVYDSVAPVVDAVAESVLLNHGEYTVHPMSTCSEDEVAGLFAKVCQRSNPVLQGRPFKDLELLGRAMYRKSAKLGMGQVTKHEGKSVGLGCCWDFAEGGVWANSGLEMPASLAAHGACGKACFDAVPKRGKKTLFVAFYGMAPPHSSHCFGIMAMSHFAMGKAYGFDEAFQFTLIPSLKGKGVFTDDKFTEDSMNWKMSFTDVTSDKEQVLEELKGLEGAISLQVTSLDYNLSDEYVTMAAMTVRMKKKEEMRAPMDILTASHLKYLQSYDFQWSQYVSPGNNQLTSRL